MSTLSTLYIVVHSVHSTICLFSVLKRFKTRCYVIGPAGTRQDIDVLHSDKM